MTISEQPQAHQTVVRTKLVERTNNDFTDDICSGYLRYYFEYEGKVLANINVYHFLMQNMLDTHGTDLFNAGYCAGWIEALIEDRQILSKSTSEGKGNE